MRTRNTSSSKEITSVSRKFLIFGDFRFDPDNGVLQRSGTELVLPPRALAVLRCLLERPGDVVSKDDLIETGWKDVAVGDQSLSEAVGILRKALDDDPQIPTFIQTVHRRGYRFISPVSVEAGEGAPPVLEVRTPAPPRWQRWLVLASLFPILALATAWYINSTAPTANPAPTVKLVARGWEPHTCSLSRDGSRLAFIADNGDVVVKDLQAARDRRITRTRGSYTDWPPVWSPDGQSIAFILHSAESEKPNQLLTVPVSGGTPRLVFEPESTKPGAESLETPRVTRRFDNLVHRHKLGEPNLDDARLSGNVLR